MAKMALDKTPSVPIAPKNFCRLGVKRKGTLSVCPNSGRERLKAANRGFSRRSQDREESNLQVSKSVVNTEPVVREKEIRLGLRFPTEKMKVMKMKEAKFSVICFRICQRSAGVAIVFDMYCALC